MNRPSHFFIFLSVLLGYSSLVQTSEADPSNGTTSVTEIQASVSAFAAQYRQTLQQQYGTESRIETRISPLDPRLNLADCPAPLETSMKQGGSKSRINVKVSCSEGKNWSIYVPVTLAIYRPVVVALEPIARGTTLNRSQLQLRETRISQLRGSYYTQIDDAAGMVAKRLINSGTTLTRDQVALPLIVKKGDAVLVTASTSGLQVKMPGIALNDGHIGEQIRVKNQQSKRTIDARVTGPGQVKVLM